MAMNTSLNPNSRKSARLGFWAGRVLGWFGKKKTPLTPADVQKLDFSPNTQKLGLRFTDSIRDFFRFRWLRGR
jgi:hypothetical protein